MGSIDAIFEQFGDVFQQFVGAISEGLLELIK